MSRVTLGFSRATRTRTRANPYPLPRVGVSAGQGKGFTKPGGIPTRARVQHSNQPGNLAIALRMSNDTAVQYCEVGKVVPAFVGSFEPHCAVRACIRRRNATKSASGSLLYAREVEEARTGLVVVYVQSSRWCWWTQWWPTPTLGPLWALVMGADGHERSPPARSCMRGRWLVVARMAVCGVRERAAHVQTSFQC